jgi:DNA-directed RNA polymerase subunit M
VVEQLEMHPKVKIICEKCGNNAAYFWTQQTRAADEPETRFFKCTKCKHTWREYS